MSDRPIARLELWMLALEDTSGANDGKKDSTDRENKEGEENNREEREGSESCLVLRLVSIIG